MKACEYNQQRVKTSLGMLVEKELVYPTPDGYVIYDRLMAEHLRTLGK